MARNQALLRDVGTSGGDGSGSGSPLENLSIKNHDFDGHDGPQ